MFSSVLLHKVNSAMALFDADTDTLGFGRKYGVGLAKREQTGTHGVKDFGVEDFRVCGPCSV